jgi:Na+/glutamate symporter
MTAEEITFVWVIGITCGFVGLIIGGVIGYHIKKWG